MFIISSIIYSSFKKISPIGVFYYVLGNLSPKYRSQSHNIQLALIVKCRFIKKYGMDAILKPVVDDILQLVGCVCVYASILYRLIISGKRICISD